MVFLFAASLCLSANSRAESISSADILEAASKVPENGFALPIACGKSLPCMVQFHPDLGPGEKVEDYLCGPDSYGGHTGTDFRVRSGSDLRAGVAVLAAAGGRVVLARDDTADDSISQSAQPGPRATNGNAIVIDHGGGWQTRYNHLKQGSFHVRVGEEVPRGAVLAQVGLSGHTNYPHLHFEVIYHGTRLDPFSGRSLEAGCAGEQHSLWHEKAVGQFSKTQGGILDSGFSSEALDPDQIRDGPPRLLTAMTTTERLLFWANAWALRAGDSDIMTLVGPEDTILAHSEMQLDQNHHDWVRSLAIQVPIEGWPKGKYIGTYRVYRGEVSDRNLIIEVRRTVEVK